MVTYVYNDLGMGGGSLECSIIWSFAHSLANSNLQIFIHRFKRSKNPTLNNK